MANTFFQLQYSYYGDLERYLMIYSDLGIKNDEIADLQVKMLQSNPIPKVLSVEIEEIDFQVKLRYKLGSFKSLNHVLKEQKLAKEEYLLLIRQIIQTIDQSKYYMLHEQNYVLDKNFIYVGKNIEDIYLVYLPFKSISKTETLQNELRKIILDLYDAVDEFAWDSLHRIIDFINHENFTLSKLMLLLISLDNQNSSQEGQIIQKDMKKDNIISKNKMNLFKKNKKGHKNSLLIKNDEKRPFSERERILLYGSALILIAFVWRIYLDHEGEGLFYLSIGISIAISDIAFIIDKLRPSFQIFARKGKMVYEQENNLINPAHDIKFNSDVYTSIIQNDETVWLSTLSEKKWNRVYLEINNGDMKKIIINKNRFLIGRNVKEVDYLIDSKGISRTHLEIMESKNGHMIKDLRSKNGTFLNGNKLIPNNHYYLGNGDIIKIGEMELTYKVEEDIAVEG